MLTQSSKRWSTCKIRQKRVIVFWNACWMCIGTRNVKKITRKDLFQSFMTLLSQGGRKLRSIFALLCKPLTREIALSIDLRRTERSGGIWCASPYLVHFLSVLSPKLICVTPIMPYLCLITITNVRATVGWRVKSENKKKIMKKQSKMVKNLHNCFNDLKKIICDNHMRSNASPIASGTCSGSQWELMSWKNDTKVQKIWL